MKKLLRTIILASFLLGLFLSAFSPVLAEGEEDPQPSGEDETILLTDRFYCITSQSNQTMQVPFNRSWFKNSATEYNHDLAKLSLGLATAAFRPSAALKNEETPYTDSNLLTFLAMAGFDGLRSDDYDKDPSRYTVSTVMGHQKIGGGEEAFELIAVGICGQGYVDEWESNFSIGTGMIPDGFDRASRLVFDRIFGYIADKHIEGPVKIWLSGFSRAAAISNITAARLSDTDTFSQDTVFAYTFGTPYTVRDEDGLKKYHNIFNICGKMDPVTAVPFADWGYTRFGVTLLTPAQETDSDFAAKRLKANSVYRQITGIDYWTNADMNRQLRVVMDYLLRICPNVDTYVEHLQDNLIYLWEQHDAVSVMTKLLELANDPILINEENRQDANRLLNSVTYLILDYMSSDNAFRRWNASASMGSNLLQAHTPELYISWVFSTERGSELYTRSKDFVELYIDGDVIATLYRGSNKLETLETGETENLAAHQYLNYRNTYITVLIPRDRDYHIQLISNTDQTVSLAEGDYRIGHQTPKDTVTEYYEMDAGESMVISYSADGISQSVEESYRTVGEFEGSDYFSTERLYSFLNGRMGDLSWRDFILVVFVLVVLVLSFLVFLAALIVSWLRYRHRRKHGFVPKNARFRPLPIVCTFLAFETFLIMEFHNMIYEPDPGLTMRQKGFIALMTLIIAFYGYRRKKDRFHLLLIGVILLLGVADVLTSISLRWGALVHITSYLLLTYMFLREDWPGRLQFLIWGAIAIVGVYHLMKVPGDFGYLRALAVFYVLASSAMVVSAFHLAARTFRGTLLLFVSGILLIYNQVRGTALLSHALSLGVYYLAVILLASSGSGFARARIVPETVLEKAADKDAAETGVQ